MPHPAHFICGNDCRFHLATAVGKYLVSTVGEYLPDSAVREILAETRGIELEGKGDARRYDYMNKIGFEEIGFGRKYETMVFKSKPSDQKCCPWTAEEFLEIDANGYNEAGDAYAGHLAMCHKWAGEEQ
jgi:hypothetical protein